MAFVGVKVLIKAAKLVPLLNELMELLNAVRLKAECCNAKH
jgi:hypothetical protein